MIIDQHARRLQQDLRVQTTFAKQLRRAAGVGGYRSQEVTGRGALAPPFGHVFCQPAQRD
jgi:hypothetical protein